MNPAANVAWRAEPSGSRTRWLTLGGFGLLVGAVAVLYLAGYFFLWSLHVDPLQTTPLTWIRYWVYYGSHPALHQRLLWCAVLSLGLLGAAGVFFVLPTRASLHGDARFARRAEVARAGLLGDQGIILGRLGSRLLMLAGQQSVILAAPPRSGKDVGVVVPTGLTWPGSLVQVDIKRESWSLTAGFRQRHGQACFRYEPLEPNGDTARSNPLRYVSSIPGRRINDIQRIADDLYAETPGTDPFWTASARSLFVGIVLFLFESEDFPKTIGEVRRQGMANDDEGFGPHWRRIIQDRNARGTPLSAECVRSLYDVIDLAPVTASSVRKTFTSRLDLWANPLLDAATAEDDFDLRELRKRPMSIYVCVNPDDLHRLRPLLSLFFQQLIGLQTQELPEHNPELRHQVLLLLNEFTALGRISIVSEAMAYLPGYNVRTLLVIQAPSQLREVYGVHAAETMMKSVAARVVFAPKDYADAKEISDELGVRTVRVRSRSRPAFFSPQRRGGHEGSTTESPHARALMLPQEVKEMGTEQVLIFYEGLRPIRCRKIRYYRDRRFRARVLPPPATATPAGRMGPTPPPAPSSAGPRLPQPDPASDAEPTNINTPHPGTVSGVAAPMRPLTWADLPPEIQSLHFEHAGTRPTADELAADARHFVATFAGIQETLHGSSP